jgi:hypothetical protein
MPQPFGKRDRYVDAMPVAKRKRLKTQTTPSASPTKLYLYIAGGALILIVASLALVQQ